MRYLLIGIALLAITSAFAAAGTPPQNDSADVQMIIGKWVDVDVTTAPTTAFVAADYAPTTSGVVDVTYQVGIKTNCVWDVAAVQTDLVKAAPNGDTIPKAGITVSGLNVGNLSTGNAGVTRDVVATYTRDGLNDWEGTYNGTLTVTVTSP